MSFSFVASLHTVKNSQGKHWS